MRRAVIILAGIVLVLVAFFTVVSAQEKNVNLAGTWTGYTLLGDGNRADFSLILEKSETGYGGKITDEAGIIPEMPIKNVTFKDVLLGFEIEYPAGMEIQLIKIELKYDSDTLKGSWTDPEGNSNIIELARKK